MSYPTLATRQPGSASILRLVATSPLKNHLCLTLGGRFWKIPRDFFHSQAQFSQQYFQFTKVSRDTPAEADSNLVEKEICGSQFEPRPDSMDRNLNSIRICSITVTNRSELIKGKAPLQLKRGVVTSKVFAVASILVLATSLNRACRVHVTVG
ncbi:hypothetical protein VNO77_26958 [Canavalia gladiata]|uniref:Uncharacterized protein n=1 Tax=Canavalia gladiata TaxID=3824 RepID=A0AAN9KWX8_CANGL